MTKELPSPETLRKLLRYVPETGKLFWRKRTPDLIPQMHNGERLCAAFNARFAEREAFTHISSNGYAQGTLFGTRYYAHRVAWALHNGEWPKAQLDHVNHTRHDNRIANLVEATNLTNGRNQSLSANNTSGINGVERRGGRWRSYINVQGKRISLGSYGSKDDAVRARANADLAYGFHPNHGSSN